VETLNPDLGVNVVNGESPETVVTIFVGADFISWPGFVFAKTNGKWTKKMSTGEKKT